ncbi:hypothetical protein [Oceaniradius stylonematis]|uniref:hypothetical protein n=1 Tax=Oceaniradius stylonematis TaxID=2184161 RepID=UPI00273FC751|nr:hypothetical protein [Oceaniradius stylonematis]
MPVDGAIPNMKQSGRLSARASQVAVDRNGVRRVSEHLTGIEAGLLAVDDRKDLLFLRVPDQAIGRLAVNGSEFAFTVDDRCTGLFCVVVR